MNQNICTVKWIKNAIEFTDLLNIFERKNNPVLCRDNAMGTKKEAICHVNHRCYYTNSSI